MRGAILLSIGLLAGAGCIGRAPDERPAPPGRLLHVVRVPREAAQPASDDEYLQLVAGPAFITQNRASTFLRMLRALVVDDQRTLVLTVVARLNQQSFSAFPLHGFERSGRTVSASAHQGTPLTVPMRLQAADDFSVTLAFKEVTKTAEGALVTAARQFAGAQGLLPFAAPGTALTVDAAAAALVALVQAMSGPSGVTLEVEDHPNPLAALDALVVVPAADVEEFERRRSRLLAPGAAFVADDPTFVVLEVRRHRELLRPEVALANSPQLRQQVQPFLDGIAGAGSSGAKVARCLELRRFIETQLALNARDETNLVLAAMRQGGYDPDASAWHLAAGCFGRDDLARARAAGFRYGSCQADRFCQGAMGFTNAWLLGADPGRYATSEILWQDHRIGTGLVRGTPDEFIAAYHVEPRYRRSRAASLTSYAIAARVAAGRGPARPVRVIYSFAPGADGTLPLIGRVDLFGAGGSP